MEKIQASQEIKDLAELLGYDNDIFKLSDKQKDVLKQRFGMNLYTSGIYISDSEIFITSENVLKNWLYYAGFEYIGNGYDIIKKSSTGEYLAVFNNNEDRVNDILELLEDSDDEDSDEE